MVSQRREPVVGWLATGKGDELWPGVLLHPDAFVVRAPTQVLHDPDGQLSVILGLSARPVGEILIIDDAGPSTEAPSTHDTATHDTATQDTAAQAATHDTAMIRLRHHEPGAASITLDRASVVAEWSTGATTWSMLRGTGVLPARWPEPPAGRRPGGVEPGPIAVKAVQAAPADWCTIFWWLC